MSTKGFSFVAVVLAAFLLPMVIQGEMSGSQDGVRTNSNEINEDVPLPPANEDQQVSSELRAFLSRRSRHPSSSGSGHPHQAVDSNWSASDPSSPSTTNVVTCHVEVQVVQRIPGRCIRLGGGHIRACRTPNNWLSLNAEECLDPAH